MSSLFLSICIPSFNRPDQLCQLLSSIDCDPTGIEIVICEDFSPTRAEIRSRINAFSKNSPYLIRYFENASNLGFDGNLRELVKCANGKFLIFMGDDDLFVPQALDLYITFLHQNSEIPYVLRSYMTCHLDGRVENFHYLPEAKLLPHSEAMVAWLFKRSVTISGFTISGSLAKKHSTDALDGTLLYQVYLMAQVCLKYDSVYCDIPAAHAVQSYRGGKSMFGSSSAESGRFTPGVVSHDNSINFTKAYFEVASYIDGIHGTNLKNLVRINLSKYSYPFLSIQRKCGIKSFLRYAERLENEVGFGCTFYYYIYKWSLVLLGERMCDLLIGIIKRKVGFAPNF